MIGDDDLRDCFAFADEMMEARKAEPEQEVGIVAAKSRRKAKDA